MLAVLVPPSAWRTSQSSVTCCSPRPDRSVTARRLRPIRRCISWVRPDWRPLAASRSMRSGDEPGSIEYSAVTQPLPDTPHPPRRLFGERGRAKDRRTAHPDQHRARGELSEVPLQLHRAQLVRSAPVGPCSRRRSTGQIAHVFPTSATSTGPPNAAAASLLG